MKSPMSRCMFSKLESAWTISYCSSWTCNFVFYVMSMTCFNFRVEMGHSISRAAGVPLGDVLVNGVQAVNISGSNCLTASLWITGVNGACNYRGVILSANYTYNYNLLINNFKSSKGKMLELMLYWQKVSCHFDVWLACNWVLVLVMFVDTISWHNNDIIILCES